MNFLLGYIKGFFTPVGKLRVFFNPNMDLSRCHARMWDQTGSYEDDGSDIGLMLSHPEVLISGRRKHLVAIFEQAKDCGYDPIQLRVGSRFYPAVYRKGESNYTPFSPEGV